MNTLIVTVAGLSSRFEQSIGRPCLKCLYTEGSPEDCSLYKIIRMSDAYDRIIVVGGHRINELATYIDQLNVDSDKIELVMNERYRDGSGLSLKVGIESALEFGFNSLTFAEGDLWVPPNEFELIIKTDGNIVTANTAPIRADKSVVMYETADRRIHYVYDTGHKLLYIPEEFIAIYNSGQIWKFDDEKTVREAYDSLDETDWQKTNLAFIQRYFDIVPAGQFNLMTFSKWINCNTVDDYREMMRESHDVYQ